MELTVQAKLRELFRSRGLYKLIQAIHSFIFPSFPSECHDQVSAVSSSLLEQGCELSNEYKGLGAPTVFTFMLIHWWLCSMSNPGHYYCDELISGSASLVKMVAKY